MSTGYTDYFQYFYTNPQLSLQRAYAHLQALFDMQGPRTAADGVQYDPEVVEAAIIRTERHIKDLNQRLNGVGMPRLIPTRRVDPGPNVGISGSGSIPNSGSGP